MMDLVLERKDQENKTLILGNDHAAVGISPLVDCDYWSYRVMVSECQAVVGFPKFGTIGIGFAVETNWNTNLPYRTNTPERIYEHIRCNKGDKSIPDERCIEAIRMIQRAATEDRSQQ